MAAVHAPPTGQLLFVSGIVLAIFGLQLAFWLWMLRDCIINELPGSRKKRAWAVFIAVFGVFGALAYNVGRRKQRIKELGR